MIRLQVIGHLGSDCLVKTIDNSQQKAINFSVAHTEKYKDAQGVLKEKTIWVECTMWRENIAIAQYLKKGTQVYVEGTPSVNAYMGNDSSIKSSQRLTVTSVQLLGSSSGAKDAPAQNQQSVNTASADAVDDLPF